MYAATAPAIKGGEYIGPGGRGGRKGYPKKDDIIEKLYDADTSNKLWDVSETLTGVNFKFD